MTVGKHTCPIGLLVLDISTNTDPNAIYALAAWHQLNYLSTSKELHLFSGTFHLNTFILIELYLEEI